MNDAASILSPTFSKPNPTRDQRYGGDEAVASMLAAKSESFAHLLNDRLASARLSPDGQAPSSRTTARTDEPMDPRNGSDRAGRNRDGRVSGSNVQDVGGAKQTIRAKQMTEGVEEPEAANEASESEPDQVQEPSEGNTDEPLDTFDPATGQIKAGVGAAARMGPTGTLLVSQGGAMRLGDGWRVIQGTAHQTGLEAEQPDAQQPAQIRAQVLQAISQAEGLSNGKGVIRLSLDPAHLGKVEVTIERRGGQLEVTFKVESAEAEQALRERAGELGQAILGKSSRWSDVNVTIEREGSDKEDSRTGDESQGSDHGHDTDHPGDPNESAEGEDR